MQIVTYNIHYAIGKENQYDLVRIANTVKGADIIALQEVERHYGPPDRPSQPEDLAALLPEYYWVFDAAFDIDGSRIREDGAIDNRRRQHGQMILSRWPILCKRYFPLPRLKIDCQFNMQMGVLEVVLETPVGYLRVYNAHFGSVSGDEREQQARFLLSLVENAPSRGGAWTGPASEDVDRDWSAGMSQPPMPDNTIVLGDFNMEMNSTEYGIITQTMHTNERYCLGDVMAKMNPDCDTRTWHPNPGRTENETAARLDYCFMTPNLLSLVKSAWIDEKANGSDHQPVWVELSAYAGS